PKGVAGKEGDGRGDQLEGEHERDQQHPDVFLLADRNPPDRRAAEQEHPDRKREEAERQAAADRAEHDPSVVDVSASVAAHAVTLTSAPIAKHNPRRLGGTLPLHRITVYASARVGKDTP